METEENSPEARVEKGIALLDERSGPEWVNRVNRSTLNIASSYSCVLGQTFDHFHDALRQLWPESPSEADTYCCVTCDGMAREVWDALQGGGGSAREQLAREHGFLWDTWDDVDRNALQDVWMSRLGTLQLERAPQAA